MICARRLVICEVRLIASAYRIEASPSTQRTFPRGLKHDPTLQTTFILIKASTMGWAVGYDEHWKRDVGYGVPAFCDHPDCSAEIDRGLAYVCGQYPFGGEDGCGLHFCPTHLLFPGQLCERCFTRNEDDMTWAPFDAKPGSVLTACC